MGTVGGLVGLVVSMVGVVAGVLWKEIQRLICEAIFIIQMFVAAEKSHNHH